MTTTQTANRGHAHGVSEAPERKPTPIESVRALARVATNRLDALTKLTLQHPDGLTLRLPRRRLVVEGCPQAARRVLVEHAGSYTKGLGQAEAGRYLGHGILTAEGDDWARQRSDLAPLLAARRIRPQTETIFALAREHILSLSTTEWTEVEIQHALADYTLACLGETIGFTPPRAAEIIDALDHIQQRAMLDATLSGVLPLHLLPARTPKMKRARATLERAADASLATLSSENAHAAWATRDGMISLFLAGYETTASTLSWITHHLARDPMLQARVAAEARAHVDCSGRLHSPDQLTLARAVLTEGLRLRPPVWLISRRVQPGQADTLKTGPSAGDDIAICVHALQRPANTPHRDQFDPDRDPLSGPRYMPFGVGPRACPGGTLATIESVAWIAQVCQTLEMALIPGTRPEPEARMSQSIYGGYRVLVRTRDNQAGGDTSTRPLPAP